MPAIGRVTYAPGDGADKLFTKDFCDYLVAAHDALDGRARQLRAAREALVKRALDGHPVTHLPPSKATTTDWNLDTFLPRSGMLMNRLSERLWKILLWNYELSQ